MTFVLVLTASLLGGLFFFALESPVFYTIPKKISKKVANLFGGQIKSPVLCVNKTFKHTHHD